MSAAKEIEISGFEPITEIKDNVVTVTYPKETYINLAKEAGITAKQIDEVKSFDTNFLKNIVTQTSNAFVEGYKSDAKATDHTMKYETPFNKVEISGKRFENKTVMDKEYQLTSLKVDIKRDVHGLSNMVKLIKKDMFSKIN